VKLIKLTENIFQVNFKSQKKLAKTFLRFQEFYESPKFKNTIFTLREFKHWYKSKHGSFSYYTDWNGFNIPSYILKPFLSGKFNPLYGEEIRLISLLKDILKLDYPFYIIGTCDSCKVALKHEMCHALYSTCLEYTNLVKKELDKYDLSELKQWLIEEGYCEEVLDDECQAYIISDRNWLKKEHGVDTPKELQEKLKQLRDVYSL